MLARGKGRMKRERGGIKVSEDGEKSVSEVGKREEGQKKRG